MFRTRNVTAEIFSTFTAHLTAATHNFLPVARFLPRRVAKFETRLRQRHETCAQRNQRLEFDSRAPTLFIDITVLSNLHLSRVVYDSFTDQSQHRHPERAFLRETSY
jgi:hypothetical protein